MTPRYPDILSRLPGWLAPGTTSIVLDGEAVAWDPDKAKILPFQVGCCWLGCFYLLLFLFQSDAVDREGRQEGGEGPGTLTRGRGLALPRLVGSSGCKLAGRRALAVAVWGEKALWGLQLSWSPLLSRCCLCSPCRCCPRVRARRWLWQTSKCRCVSWMCAAVAAAYYSGHTLSVCQRGVVINCCTGSLWEHGGSSWH